MRTARYLVVLLVLCTACASDEPEASEAANPASTVSLPRSDSLFEHARRLAREARYDSAIVYLAGVGERYQQHEQWEHHIHSLNLRGAYSWRNGAYDDALNYLNQALILGLQRLGDQHPEVAFSYSNLATVHGIMGHYDQALTLYEKALAIDIAELGEQHAQVAGIYNNMGLAYANKGDYDQALLFHHKALALKQALYGDNHQHVASSYNNMGMAYAALHKYDAALASYQKALQVSIAVLGDQHPTVGANCHNIGLVYAAQGDYEQALRFYARALTIWQATLGVHSDMAALYNSRGDAFFEQGEYEQALRSYEEALAVGRATLGEHHPDVAASYTHIGQVRAAQGQYDRALDAYQRAFRANVPTFANAGVLANPSLDDVLSADVLLQSLGSKAAALTARYANQSHDLHDLEAAVAVYQLATQLIYEMREEYKTERSKLFLAKKGTNIFEEAIRTALRRYSVTLDEDHKAVAFQFAEKSKASILREALQESQAKQFAGIPDSLLEREQQLHMDLSFYEKSLAEEQLNGAMVDSVRVARLRDEVFTHRRSYNVLIEQFESEYPAYYALKYQLKTASVDDVQRALLDQHSALIQYVTGTDSLYIFTVTRAAFEVATAPRDTLYQHVEQLRSGIIGQNYAEYTAAAYSLYQRLLAPVIENLDVERLIIVPDGSLNYVPFEALLTHAVDRDGASGVSDYRALPYLLNEYAISYAYSATLLLETAQRKRNATRDYLAFAPIFPQGVPDSTRGAALFDMYQAHAAGTRGTTGALLASRDEVTHVGKLFSDRHGFLERLLGEKTTVYLGEDAREEYVKSAEVGTYRYVHFATHGFVNEAAPELSGLLLSPHSGAGEDDVLYLGEVYALHLNADLVVLSACETGLGSLAQGEGIIGLTRGFLYAGAENVMASLWQADDATTADVIVAFFTGVLHDASQVEALRAAKRAMIQQDAKHARPYYWAPFILVGR